MELHCRAGLAGIFAAVVLVAPLGCGADEPDCIRGVVLRTQALPAGAGEAPMTRALLSTDEGLCAVRLPGPNEGWIGFADATVEIFGTLSGSEFVVDSKSAVHILKYPPLSPTVVHDVLPAGEIVYRRRVEAEIAAHRRQLNFAWLSVGLIALAVAVLVWMFVSSARKRRRQVGRLLRDLMRGRRQAGQLRESVEQRLTGARLLLQMALDMVEDGDRSPLVDAAATAANVLAETNSEIHAQSYGEKSKKTGRERA